MTGYQKRCP